MTGNEKGSKREEVPLERIVLSNMYSLEALIDVLAEKGLVTREEVLKRMEKVVEERGNGSHQATNGYFLATI